MRRKFKLEVVKLVNERGMSVPQVAKDLDIGPSVVLVAEVVRCFGIFQH